MSCRSFQAGTRAASSSLSACSNIGLFCATPPERIKASGSSQVYPIYHIALNATYVPTPNFIAEFTWGTYRDNDKFLENGPLSSRSRAPGLSIPEIFPLNELDRIPTLYFNQGYSGIVEEWYFHNYSYSMPFASNNTWTRGRHTMQFGLAFTRERKSELANPSNNNTNGTFTFTGRERSRWRGGRFA